MLNRKKKSHLQQVVCNYADTRIDHCSFVYIGYGNRAINFHYGLM